ncbi:efflux RND transporter periplasmic adaptor subunit [Halopseudomonas salina]|uniref:RND transporter MFP subunit n=1 Tax=Halopseudomonas salina TaxID=1323744 RepID=A0ABQ1P6H7_9GAMM|nr:efflux RND transporter periplasmic adaptor subunit [Halopseudomonas salina]GGC90075.1 RND transporter MFP subunit [Halopseudomonas salina]
MRRLSPSLQGILLGIVASSLIACSPEPPEQRKQTATPIAAFEVTRRDLSRPLRLAATVEPAVVISLAARTEGTVREILVEEGDRVEAGQLMAQLDVAEAAAELSRAKAVMASAQLDFTRATELKRRGVASQIEYQAADVALQVARSERELWQSRVDYGRIEAPRDSTVVMRHIEPGEAVEAQDTLFDLADLDHLVLRPGISELDVVHLQVDQLLPVSVDALPELDLEGRIRRIFPAAIGASRLITVEVTLPGNAWDEGIRPGFLARIESAIDRRPNTLVVPAAALGSEGIQQYLYLIENNTLVRREVEIGITRDRWVEVLGGVEAGDMVLASSPIDMLDGQQVQIVAQHD